MNAIVGNAVVVNIDIILLPSLFNIHILYRLSHALVT